MSQLHALSFHAASVRQQLPIRQLIYVVCISAARPTHRGEKLAEVIDVCGSSGPFRAAFSQNVPDIPGGAHFEYCLPRGSYTWGMHDSNGLHVHVVFIGNCFEVI
jgi:hypothetical protein